MTRLLGLAGLFLLLAGCATPTLYTWGQYEELVYVSYAAPGKLPPETQIEKMEQDYQKARSANKRMHPGFHAYLGYLYFQTGKFDQARQEFETEKAEFPESAVLMDRMLANLKKVVKLRILLQAAVGAGLALVFAGCASKPYDYTNYRASRPRSILVLPPLNESTSIEATYGYLSTVTYPLAELGYYVFPVSVVDHFLKENGMPTAGEMHQVPLNKVAEVIGADAVLYVTLREYGTNNQLINSATTVSVRAKLVDTRTGLLLWEGEAVARQNSAGGNPLIDLVSAAITQAINSSTDAAHSACPGANTLLFTLKDHGLLYGPYHPKSDTDQ